MAISWINQGRRRLRSVKPNEQIELKQLTDRYRDFRKTRKQLVALHSQMLDVIDQLETARCREP